MNNSTQIPNRLINEKSPYLLQHAYNPVDWFPWGGEAFAKAQKKDKPVFLSIGYSTCHWCHVMERESFEDESVADLLNKEFISIKLDREERPDIDQIYMEACHLLGSHGGWPLSVFMDADGRPFFIGTYFPKTVFTDLLSQITQLWKTDRENLLSSAKQIVSYLKSQDLSKKETPKNHPDLPELAVKKMLVSFDAQYGGFSHAPKFPSAHGLIFLLEYARQRKDEITLRMAEKTLEGIFLGGIHDHIGGGFSRYSTDEKWLVPHFEKMLYDNALLLFAYSHAYEQTGKEIYRYSADRTAEYLLRDMRSPQGGFYTAEDADSEGEEGKFYVWTPGEVEQVLGADAHLFNDRYDISNAGNFEGKCIPNLIAAGAEKWSIDILPMLDLLFEHREKRVHPHKDRKILTGQNGLVIAALSFYGSILKRPDAIYAAESAALFIENELAGNQGRLLSRYCDGQSDFPAHAEDYAFYLWGLLELHRVTHRLEHLERAIELADILLQDFWDEENGGLYFTGKQSEKLIIRPKQKYDNAYPSASSVAAYCFSRLFLITGDVKWQTHAKDIWDSAEAQRYPTAFTFLMFAKLYEQSNTRKIIMTAEKAYELKPFLEVLEGVITPMDEVVQLTREKNLPHRLSGYMGDYLKTDMRPAVYVCSGQVCHAPVYTIDELSLLLGNSGMENEKPLCYN